MNRGFALRRLAWLFLSGSLVLVVGCGGGDSESAVRQGGLGTYVVQQDGTRVTITTPAPSGNEIVRDLERFRSLTDGDAPRSYVVITIDNTSGESEAGIDDLRVVTGGGETISFQTPDQLINDWRDTLPEGDVTTYNESVTLNNRLMEAESALPGARTATVRASDQPLDSISRVFYGADEAKKQ